MEEKAEEWSTSGELKFRVKGLANCRLEVEVVAVPPLLNEAKEKALREVGKEVTLPGFRKGKAPVPLILKNYPKQVQDEWGRQAAQLIFDVLLRQNAVPRPHQHSPFGYRTQEWSDAEAKLLLHYEKEPEVPLPNAKEIQLEKIEATTVTEEHVEEAMRQIRLFLSTWKEIDDRGAQESDFVRINLDMIESEPAMEVFRNTRFEMLGHRMANWMLELLKGMKKGETREGVSHVTEEEKKTLKDQIPQEKRVRLHLIALEKPEMPNFDDALAKSLGAETLEAMRNNTKLLLEKTARDAVREQQRQVVQKFLLEKCIFEMPLSMIEKEVNHRMQQLLREPDAQREWRSMSDAERKQIIQQMAISSEQALRLFMISRKLLHDNNITLTADDFRDVPTTPLETIFTPYQPHGQAHSNVMQSSVYSWGILQKAEDYLIAQSGVAQIANV